MARSLYICYFGVTEPLVQTQVIPYLRELVKGGHEIELLTFEPADPGGGAEGIREELRRDGIEWHWMRYHKRPSVPATLFDIANGARFVRKLANRKPYDILHGRAHVPMMMAAIARKGIRRKPKLLFDIRGFMPEEYVDGGLWPEGGAIYRNVKRAEAWLMREADGFVVLTEAARGLISKEVGGRAIEVIPCCVDFGRFESANERSRSITREKLGIGDRFALAYVGAFGGWYLTNETAKLYGALKRSRPDSFALILTQSDRTMIEPLLREQGYGEGDFFVGRVDSFEIPKYLSAADAAVSFIKNCYSKKASSPTKNAEYLACGLPIIANSGIGDVDQLIQQGRAGALVTDFSEEDYLRAFDEIEVIRDSSGQLEALARAEFDLETVGGVRYRRLYSRLLSH